MEIADQVELDLVEIAPDAKPPVCRIVDYGKFRYDKEKKAKEARKRQKNVQMKGIRIAGANISDHDLEYRVSHIREFIEKGKIVSIISDAGTPTISDPGLILIKECIKKKINVFPIPGVSAVATAMSVSGFDDKYFFYGFLPKKDKELQKIFNELRHYNFNIVFFIPAIKINFYIKLFKKYFLNRELLVAKEMTKIHENFYRKDLGSFDGFKSKMKGELTVVISELSLIHI